MRKLVMLLMLVGCDPDLDADGRRMALAGDGVSTGLEASFKAGWVITPAANLDSDAIEATRIVVNTVFGLCASASSSEHALSIRFNGNCGVPFTDLRFEGGLALETVEGTLKIAFDHLHLPSIEVSGGADFTRLPDGSFAWEFRQFSASVSDHAFTLDGSGSVRYSSDRTVVVYDGAGRLSSDDVTVSFVADNIARQLIDGCWPDRGTLTITLEVAGVARTQIIHYTGDRTVHLDDKGRTLDHDLPDRDCRTLF